MTLSTGSAAPRLSILIPTIDPASTLDACLASLRAHLPHRVPVEVLVVLNGVSAPGSIALPHGARLLSSPVNRGFAGALNWAAAERQGRDLAFLNDDALIEPGWLEALLTVLDERSGAGAVGSQLLFGDGRLQESGAIVFRDGRVAQVGRGGTEADRSASVRSVDYCSASSLLVRGEAWDASGGFSEDYYPAYYEDVDLCLRIRRAGYEVVYTPHSRVRHLEGRSTDRAFRQFLLERNRATLRRRWQAELAICDDYDRPPAESLVRATERLGCNGRRVLLVDDGFPNRLAGAGLGRAAEAVHELASTGTMVRCVSTIGLSALAPELARLGVEAVSEPLERHLARPEILYDVIVVSRPTNFERTRELAARWQPQAAVIYDAEALYHRRLQRQAALVDAGTCRALREDAARFEQLEGRIAASADAIVCVSDEEAAFFESRAGRGAVTTLAPRSSHIRLSPAAFEARADAVLIAGWLGGDDTPNADGLRWFEREVLPLVRAAWPGFRLLVSGRPPAALADGRSIVGLGAVADLAAVYGRARAAIAPLRFGAGVKVKVVEALQHGVPVVTTWVGAEGVSWSGSAVHEADDAAAFARALVALTTEREAWTAARHDVERTLARWARQPQDTWTSVVERVRLARAGASGASGPFHRTESRRNTTSA